MDADWRAGIDLAEIPPFDMLMEKVAMLAVAVILAGHPLATAAYAAGCTCRATDGTDVAEGQTACIRSPNGPVMARCTKYLNNTTWKLLDQQCPLAVFRPRLPDRQEVVVSSDG